MKCAKCGREITRGAYITEDDELVCGDCAGTFYTQCTSCGRLLPREGHSRGVCSTCANDVFKKVVNSYSTKISSVFGNKGKNTKCLNNRYFGMELEFSNITPASAKYAFKELYTDHKIYNKSDGSLSGGGVEIVTIPCTASVLKSTINKMDFDTFKSMSYGDTSDCAGVHIHVSRNTISPIASTKLSFLFNHRSNRRYKKLLYYIVGRRGGIRGLLDSSGCNDHYYAIGTCNSMRYLSSQSGHGCAYNLGNTSTVEFRLFKSTTNKEQLLAYLEFVEKAIKYAETQSLSMMTIPNFIRYLDVVTENNWLKGRVREVISHYDDDIPLKPIDFSCNLYMEIIKDIPMKYMPQAFRFLRGIPRGALEEHGRNNKFTLSSLERMYCDLRDGSTNKMVDVVENKIRKELIDTILSK